MSSGRTDPSEIRFGKYLVVEPLKTGGTAAIYLAVMRGENQFTREVVIKRPLPHLIADRRLRTMFIDEAHLASRLQHPNIVQVIDLVARDDDVYLVLEYLKGRDLREITRRATELGRAIPVEVAVWIASEVAAGLDFAHEATAGDGSKLNLVHRDVSPKNIRVTDAGHVKVIDFGIAQADHRLSETAPGSVKGTLGYMSPEQVLGELIDRRADIFSFGICFFQMLTGRNPFEASTLKERIHKLVQAPVPKVREFNPQIDERLEQIVDTCMARDIDLRYAKLSIVQHELESYLMDLRVASPRQRLVSFLEEIFPDIHEAHPRLRDTLTAISATGMRFPPAASPELDLKQPESDPSLAFRSEIAPTESAAAADILPPAVVPLPSTEGPIDVRETERSARPPPNTGELNGGLSGGAWSAWAGPPATSFRISSPPGQIGPPPAAGPDTGVSTIRGEPLGARRPTRTSSTMVIASAVLVAGALGIWLGLSRSAPDGPEAVSLGVPLSPVGAIPSHPPSTASTATARPAIAPATNAASRANAASGAIAASGGNAASGANAASGNNPAPHPAGAASKSRLMARNYLVAGAHLSKQGQLDDARFLYTLAYAASGADVDPSIFRNLALIHRDQNDVSKLRACFNMYLSKRPAAPDADKIRAVVAAYPATPSVPCVAPEEVSQAEKRAKRSGARIEAWIAEAKP